MTTKAEHQANYETKTRVPWGEVDPETKAMIRRAKNRERIVVTGREEGMADTLATLIHVGPRGGACRVLFTNGNTANVPRHRLRVPPNPESSTT